MDKYIEIFTFLFEEENVLYSIGLLVLVFFISEFIIFLWSKKSSDAIKLQLLQEKNISETATQKNEELIIAQKSKEKHIENLQQKLKQSTQSLMNVEKELADIQLTGGKFEKLYLEKQSEFDKQESQLAELSINQKKIEEIEGEAIQLAKELSFAKQQLKQTNSVSVDTVDAPVDKKVVEKITELEATIQKNNQQLVQFNEKLELLLTKPMIQNVTDNDQENEGLVGKLISLVSFYDNKKITDNVQNMDDKSIVQDHWQKHRLLINQLTDQLVVQTDNDEQKVVAIENEIEETGSNVMDDISDEIEETVEEIKEAVEENVDHFQQKLKGFYRKLVS